MKLLLDTHCWLWMQMAPGRLSEPATEWLADSSNELFLSAVTSWEIAVKWSLGKLPLPMPPEEYVPSRMERQGVRGLAIQHRHALHTASLPLHHRDPFDRLLIAQAQLEKLPLLTADRQLEAYDVEILRA
ncbi:MAG: type II toxin-antitoxin system VapC family toxin [bacterium]|nr:type II toxin-antitoxin system VapC family toxin [bacterium]